MSKFVRKRATIAFSLIIVVSCFRLWSESSRADIGVLRLLLDQNAGLVIYLSGFAVILATGYRFRHPLSQIPLGKAKGMLLVLLLAASIGWFLIGTVPAIDRGPDHDEATEAWIDALLDGDYPYNPEAHSEYSVSELTVFPALPILAMPFHLTMDVAILTVIGVATISILFNIHTHSTQTEVLALSGLLISIPLHYRLITHSNYIQLIAIFSFGLSLLTWRKPILAGGIFGLLFAAKTNTWPLLPVVGIAVLDKWYLRETIQFSATAGIIGLGFLAPFILWDPQTFFNVAPLGVATAHPNLFELSTPVFGSIVVLTSVVSYLYIRRLIVGLIIGTFTLLLGYPSRYQLFLCIFVIWWIILEEDLGDRMSIPTLS